MRVKRTFTVVLPVLALVGSSLLGSEQDSSGGVGGAAWWKPYSAPCVERENVFEFAAKPAAKRVGDDKYQIEFAVKGFCDATVGLVDEKGKIVRHLASGVLGANAPAPFQKNSLKQVLMWDGKDDLGEYVKEPLKLKIKVSLGLKPIFEKLLGGTSPKNIPGIVFGIVVGPDGGYVFSKGGGAFGVTRIRKFDRDGGYVQALTPPPTSLPESKLGGMGYVEYEPGKRAVHGPVFMSGFLYEGAVLPALKGNEVETAQLALIGNRLYFCNGGSGYFQGTNPSQLHYIYTDGSTDLAGIRGMDLIGHGTTGTSQPNPRFAVSPDGKWIYMTGVQQGWSVFPVVWRRSVDGPEPATVFIGDQKNPGSDATHLNWPSGLDCDAQGRLYVADKLNNRIQIYSPDGKCLKTILCDSPVLVRVHQKTGAIYVQHSGKVQGRSVGRITKYKAFDDPKPEFSADGFEPSVMALDSWTAKPRLWMTTGRDKLTGTREVVDAGVGSSVTIWEEDSAKLKLISDFDQEARKEAGDLYLGRWSANINDRVVCDPVRNRLYFGRRGDTVIDLETGKRLYGLHLKGIVDDVAFDKKGYMHNRMNPDWFMPGVFRTDPERAAVYSDRLGHTHEGVMDYPEVPYDYGFESDRTDQTKLLGVLPVKDQGGAKAFQDGFGVNMKGEIAVGSCIYHIPRQDDEGFKHAYAGKLARVAAGGQMWDNGDSYQVFQRKMEDAAKRGEEVYSISRNPGNPMAGAIVTTFESSGRIREQAAVILNKLVVGTQMDEDGYIYCANDRTKMVNGEPFLKNRGGNFGTDAPLPLRNAGANKSPFSGVWVKTKPKGAVWHVKESNVPMEPWPNRPPDLIGNTGTGFHDQNRLAWVENVEWVYGGVIPLALGCTCPSIRPCLDWYKRSYVPEAYRHSIGILDTNGNLIMHVGRYGNFDNGNGPDSKFPLGGDNISMFLPRFLSTTDDRLCFDDWGERLVVLKLKYETESTAAIQ